jgi:hypothetical protein
MKKIISYSLISLVCLTSCQKCKKKEKEKFTVTGIIYQNCNDVSANTTYYLVFPVNQYSNRAPIIFTTDANGVFSYEFEKYSISGANISRSTNFTKSFASYKFNDENLNLGVIREDASNQLVLKLKTNHILTNLDTIKYVFRYGDFELPIHGPITKDTIIGIYTKSINSISYNNNPSSGELKTLWWNFGQTTPTNQVQVDYTIHGCAGVADTAYIVVP